MLFFNIIFRKSFSIYILLVFFFCIPGNVYSAKHKVYFPHFKTIEDNVIFWEKIYSEFSINTGILHDKNDLSVIFEAIPLLDKSLPGARRVNKAYLKAVKKKYATILKKLAQGKKPSSANEKRVYALYSPPRIKDKFHRAAKNLRVQTGLKEQFIEGVIRSGEYIGEMKRIFRSYNLPEDLAYLPHVESSFNLEAYSKFGAAGAWQFTRSTGKNYMTINSIIDERRDPLIATHAAAKYLKRNFENLGSWPLAITAYNYGHAGMMRALKQEGTYERIFKNYNQGRFKFASRNFYSEYLAARRVAKRLEKSKTIKIGRPKQVVNVKLHGYAPLNDIARYFKLNPSVLKKYNPSLRNPIIHGEKFIPKGFRLKLPHSNNILHLAKNMPGTILRKHQKKDMFYTVKPGDTAGKIARKHRISIKQLSKANNLNSKGVIFAGQTLHIPSYKNVNKRIAQVKKGKSALSQKKELVVLKNVKKLHPSVNGDSTKQLTSHKHLTVSSFRAKNGIPFGDIIVQPEESLGMYSEWLKLPMGKLHQLNGIAQSSSVHPGQKITLQFNRTSKHNFETRRMEFHRETEENFFNSYKITGFRKYQVAIGDTIWKICQENFNLPMWLLRKYNNINYNQLSYNQNLKIPIIETLQDS